MAKFELVKNTFKSKNVLQCVEKIFNTIANDEEMSQEHKEQITKALTKLCELFDKDEKSRKFVCHLVICFSAYDANGLDEMLQQDKRLKIVELAAIKKSAILSEAVENYSTHEKTDSVISASEHSALIMFSEILYRNEVSEIVKIYETQYEIQRQRRFKQIQFENKKRAEKEAKRDYEEKHSDVLRKPSNQKIVQNLSEHTFDSLVALKDKLEAQESN